MSHEFFGGVPKSAHIDAEDCRRMLAVVDVLCVGGGQLVLPVSGPWSLSGTCYAIVLLLTPVMMVL